MSLPNHLTIYAYPLILTSTIHPNLTWYILSHPGLSSPILTNSVPSLPTLFYNNKFRQILNFVIPYLTILLNSVSS